MTATCGHQGALMWGASIDSLAVLNHVRDVVVDLTCDPADLTPHDAPGWRTSTHALRDAQISWSMLWGGTDAGLLAIRDAYLNDTPITLAALDGDTTDPTRGSEGLLATCLITAFARDERLTDTLAVHITAKPTLAASDPVWMSGLIDLDVGGFVTDDLTGQIVAVAA